MHWADDNNEEDDCDSDTDPTTFLRTLEADLLLPIKSPPTDPSHDPIFTYPDPLDPRPPEPGLAADAEVRDDSPFFRFVHGNNDDNYNDDSELEPHLHEHQRLIETTTEEDGGWDRGAGAGAAGDFIRFTHVTDRNTTPIEDEDEDEMMLTDDEVMDMDVGENPAQHNEDEDDDDVEMTQAGLETALLPMLRRCQ